MKVLVFNCGSSSLKYRLIEMPSGEERAGGEAQRVGPRTAEPPRLILRQDGRTDVRELDMPDHSAAFDRVMEVLLSDRALSPDAVGHRVVHGGTAFAHPTVVTDEVLAILESVNDLAPLHNPPAVALIEACKRRFPELPQVVVFDTAFHQTIPAGAYTYALPRSLRDGLGMRKYGFHGTSHQYVAERGAAFLGRPMAQFNAVSCHLGSGGASLCAIVNGRSMDNTMGYSPLQGLVMSTRCGDLDPAIALRLLSQSGDGADVARLLNKGSGVLGMSGISSDIRDVLAEIERGEGHRERLHLAAQVYLWRIRKYVGGYLAVVGGADAVIFTDTIGETVPQARWAVCADMAAFGLEIDPERNRAATRLPVDVAADGSAVRILVIQTNEELAIAARTHAVLGEGMAAVQGGRR